MSVWQKRVRDILASAAFLTYFFAGPQMLRAQASATASLSGTVVDASGAVIPNAKITLRNVDGETSAEQ